MIHIEKTLWALAILSWLCVFLEAVENFTFAYSFAAMAVLSGFIAFCLFAWRRYGETAEDHFDCIRE